MSKHPGLDPKLIEPLWQSEWPAIQNTVSTLLSDATESRHSPLHTLSLATATPEGVPSVRTVVLRSADWERRVVRVHSDIRSPKIAELRANPRAMLLWYAADWKLQLRMDVEFVIHHQDAIAEDAWKQTHVRSRRVYSAPHPPGTPSDVPLSDIAPALQASQPTEENTAGGYSNFAVLAGKFEAVEWLTLSAEGNRRGELRFDGQQWRGRWLAP